jgi:hypothetical protein
MAVSFDLFDGRFHESKLRQNKVDMNFDNIVGTSEVASLPWPIGHYVGQRKLIVGYHHVKIAPCKTAGASRPPPGKMTGRQWF